MNNSVFITIEDAIKYYHEGGELKKLAIKAWPNIKDIIEDKRREKEAELARRRTAAQQACIDGARDYFKVGTTFFYYDTSTKYHFFKVMSQPVFVPNYTRRMEFSITVYGENGHLINKTAEIQLPTRASKFEAEDCEIKVSYQWLSMENFSKISISEAKEKIESAYNAKIDSKEAAIEKIKEAIQYIQDSKKNALLEFEKLVKLEKGE